MTTAKKKKTIPGFKSYQDEATFWDSHSPEDFPDDFADVDVDVAGLKISTPQLDRSRFVAELAKFSEPDRQAIALILLGLDDKEIKKVINWKPADAKRIRALARRIHLAQK